MKKKINNEEFVEKLKIINPYIIALEKYQGAKTKIKFKCLKCGQEWDAQPSNIIYLGQGCPKCYGNIKRTNEQFIEELKQINPNIMPLEEYKNLSTNIKCMCLNDDCGLVWYASPRRLLHRKHGCPKCGKRHKRTTKEYKQELKDKNIQVECLGEYKNVHTSILHRCLNCGNEWNVQPHHLLRGDSCPKCISSKGEQFIRKVLLSNNIIFKEQYRFDDCKNIRSLPFDFYLPSQNMCIEYDGEQHYQPVEAFGGKDSFCKRQENDKIKTKYCQDNNIKLLRIPYWDFDNIGNILDKELG
jgi:predicted  nucleic acid-binding Zn-ribbon protein